MLGISFSGWLMLGIGFLAGLLVGNKDFRVKFFKGLRGFLSSTSKNAKEQEKRQNEELARMQKGMQQYGRKVTGEQKREETKRKPFEH